MDQVDDEILGMFIEDSREHLGDIEACLIDMERDGADIDEELVNKVFRAAHSIKGGAGFLNLGKVRDLAHKLENLLHLIRNRELVPSSQTINLLLEGFDLLLVLVEKGTNSEAEDISAMIAKLSGLTEESAPSEERADIQALVDVPLPDGRTIFTEDLFSLRQALKGGKHLYLVTYDLIHDVHARNKTPFDVIAAMESSGLIIDCKMDIASVGDLEAPLSNALPLHVLFATIVEPDVISYLFAIDSRRIAPLDLERLAASPRQAPTASPEPAAPARVGAAGGADPLEVADLSDLTDCEAAGRLRELLLERLNDDRGAVLRFAGLPAPGLALLQVLAAAGKSFARRALVLEIENGPPRDLVRTAGRAGASPEALAAAGAPPSLFFP